MPEKTLKLERQTCGRCGGCGQYSYCQMYGSRCFGCGGSGVVFTKRGAAANLYLKQLRSKPAKDLKVGDIVSHDGKWTKVLESRMGSEGDSHSLINGEKKYFYIVRTERCGHGCGPDTPFRVYISKEHELETLKQAIEYQNSLTKLGKPRKTAAK